MKWTTLPILALTLIHTWAMPADAQYLARSGEVTKEIVRFQHEPLIASLTNRIPAEFVLRNGMLEKSRNEVLRVPDPKPLKDNWSNFHQTQAKERGDHFDRFAAEAKDIIDKAKLDEEHVARLSLTWLKLIKSQQVDFHNKIKGMPLATLRDTLTAKRDAYEKALNGLTKELATLESMDASIDGYGKSYRETLLRACTDLKRAKTDWEQTFSRISPLIRDDTRHRDDPSQWMTESDADAFERALEGAVSSMIQSLQRFEGTVRDGISRIQGVHGQEWSVITMFSEKRKVVKKFQESFNYASADAQFKADIGKAREIGGKLDADNDEKDMTAFLNNAEVDLRVRLKDFEDAHKAFVTKFTGKLLAPFSRDTSEKFAEFAEWDDWADDVQACAADEIITQLRLDISKGWGVRPDHILNPDVRRIVLDAVSDQKSRANSATGGPLNEARRLDDLSQLQDRDKMLDALNRG